MKKLFPTFCLLILTGCGAVNSVIDAGKDITSAVVDDAVDIGQTMILVPVQAVGTIADKIEEEATEAKEEQKAE
jgi:hypothetical protein